MNRLELISRVRSLTRDFTGSIFREQDVIDYLNEAIDRFQMVIKQFEPMVYLENTESEPILLPKRYHHMLAVYSAGRCFALDERNYQATTLMNEFETKLEELKQLIESGDLVIAYEDGTVVEVESSSDYVRDNYYFKNRSGISADRFDRPNSGEGKEPTGDFDDDLLYWE